MNYAVYDVGLSYKFWVGARYRQIYKKKLRFEASMLDFIYK